MKEMYIQNQKSTHRQKLDDSWGATSGRMPPGDKRKNYFDSLRVIEQLRPPAVQQNDKLRPGTPPHHQ